MSARKPMEERVETALRNLEVVTRGRDGAIVYPPTFFLWVKAKRPEVYRIILQSHKPSDMQAGDLSMEFMVYLKKILRGE